MGSRRIRRRTCRRSSSRAQTNKGEMPHPPLLQRQGTEPNLLCLLLFGGGAERLALDPIKSNARVHGILPFSLNAAHRCGCGGSSGRFGTLRCRPTLFATSLLSRWRRDRAANGCVCLYDSSVVSVAVAVVVSSSRVLRSPQMSG